MANCEKFIQTVLISDSPASSSDPGQEPHRQQTVFLCPHPLGHYTTGPMPLNTLPQVLGKTACSGGSPVLTEGLAGPVMSRDTESVHILPAHFGQCFKKCQ